MITLEKFEEASELVKKVTNPTKLVWSEYLSRQTGGKVYLKPENMQHTGAYKIRGAYYKISTLSKEEREKGLNTASAGKHTQDAKSAPPLPAGMEPLPSAEALALPQQRRGPQAFLLQNPANRCRFPVPAAEVPAPLPTQPG